MQKITGTARSDLRLDVLLAEETGESRSLVAKWIAQGYVTLAGKTAQKASMKVLAGTRVEVELPPAVEAEPMGENIPITILYEDADIAVVDKPCGMVVHPAPGNESGTLVNALLYAMDDLSGIGGVKRPGIVHRLDKDTSGLMMIAKNDAAHLSLSTQLSQRSTEKHYLAMVEGEMKLSSGVVEQPIARSHADRKRMVIDPEGRYARTEWTLLENLRGAALLDVQILTGRTHQIRVHMQSLHHPVAGDVIYGFKNGVCVPRLMLHAHTLAFTHPSTGERMRFESEPSAAFVQTLKKYRP
ncbi:MAG: RluA family pseudouridine synthase [Clostridia bacterium]